MATKMPSSLFLWSLVAGLLSQSFVVPVTSSASASFGDDKTYYNHPPGHHHHHHHTPSPSVPSPTPVDPTPSVPTPSVPTPSHGSGGGSHGSTPKVCPTPSTPSTSPPSSGHGGGYYPSPTPSTPHPTPTPYTPTPSTPTPTPYTPTPSTPTPTPYTPTPSTPTPVTPIFPPSTPSTPPYVPDPNTPPFTCNYWRSHPQLIWGVLGWWGTLGNAFNVPSVPGMGSGVSLKDVLSNTHTDAYSELCRQATASFLNSMVDHHFSFSTKQVRDSFVSALGSQKTAAVQAAVFKLANEGKH